MRKSWPFLLLITYFFTLANCIISKKSKSLQQSIYIPTPDVQLVLNNINTDKKLRKIPDSLLLPYITSRLLYNGENIIGRDFGEYTASYLPNPSADVFHTLAVQNLKNGNYSLSFKYMTQAAAMDPKENAGYFGWTLLYYYRDYRRSLHFLKIFDDFTPNFSDFPSGENIDYLYGLNYFQLNEFDSSYIHFSNYIDFETKKGMADYIDPFAFVNRGRILVKLGKPVEAVNDYNKAIQYWPECLEAYYYLAEVLILFDGKELAKPNLEIALKLYQDGKKNHDVYVEYFHEIYEEDIIRLRDLTK